MEEAVEEVLELVRKAAEVFKATHENDDFDFLADGNFEFELSFLVLLKFQLFEKNVSHFLILN